MLPTSLGQFGGASLQLARTLSPLLRTALGAPAILCRHASAVPHEHPGHHQAANDWYTGAQDDLAARGVPVAALRSGALSWKRLLTVHVPLEPRPCQRHSASCLRPFSRAMQCGWRSGWSHRQPAMER